MLPDLLPQKHEITIRISPKNAAAVVLATSVVVFGTQVLSKVLIKQLDGFNRKLAKQNEDMKAIREDATEEKPNPRRTTRSTSKTPEGGKK